MKLFVIFAFALFMFKTFSVKYPSNFLQINEDSDSADSAFDPKSYSKKNNNLIILLKNFFSRKFFR